MGEFLAYCIVSGMLMLGLVLTYRLFLASEKQYAYNRGVLLTIYVVSFAFIPIASLVDKLSAPPPSAVASIADVPIADTIATEAINTPIWGTILIWAFMLGMCVVTVKTVITWVRLSIIIHQGEKVVRDGYTILLTDDIRFAPFSWRHYIVLSHDDFETGSSVILAHELKHIANKHWIDLLISQLVCIINWFNPAAWLMRDELMLVHEYQADLAVLAAGHDAKEYQLLLIKKAVGARFPSLANSLNHSKLKKRITMMYKKRSNSGQKLRALALVPAFAVALAVVSISPIRAAITTIGSSEATISKVNENVTTSQVAVTKATEEVFSKAEVMPQYPGGLQAAQQAVMAKCTYPNPGRKWKNGSSGTTIFSFTVFADGEVGDFKILSSCGYDDLDQIVLNAAKEGLTERWTPGMQGGKPVAVKYSMPVVFKTSASPQKTIVIKRDEAASTDEKIDNEKVEVDVYVDGKLSSYEELKKLPSSQIESMSIDKDGHTINVASKSQGKTIVIKRNEASSVDKKSATEKVDIEVYVDGKLSSYEELKKLPSSQIESMRIDKGGHTIHVITIK